MSAKSSMQRRKPWSRSEPLRSLARPLALGLLLGLLAPEQTRAQIAQPFPVGRIWADANHGSDTNSGSEFSPVQSITKALTLCNPIPAGFQDMVIMVKPGVYNSFIETFPLRMTKNTSIQGTSALNTIIKGDGEQGEVLIVFEANVQNEFNRSFIDAVNVHFSEVGIRIENNATHQFACRPVISNCFITDHSLWGIDIVSAPNGSSTDDLDCTPTVLLPNTGWVVHRPKIINCTFRFNRHSIMNRTNTFPLGDDDPPILGVGEPGLMNVISADSKIGGVPKDDFLGIDRKDLTIDQADPLPDITTTCAFDSAHSGGLFDPTVGCNGAGQTPLKLFLPSDVVAFVAPMFVEDVVGNPFPFPQAVDLRINPALLGQFISPVDVGYLPPGNTVTWKNGTVANLNLSRNGMVYAETLDQDAEGHCNDRVVNMIDLGADELGELVTAGYIRFTTTFRNSDTVFRWYGPGYSGTVYYAWNAALSSTLPPPFLDTHTMPYGIHPPGTVNPHTLSGYTGFSCMNTYQIQTQILDGNEPTQTIYSPAASVWINEQVAFPGSPGLISNLQSYGIFGP